MTFKVLSDNTQIVVHRSRIKSALVQVNRRADGEGDTVPTESTENSQNSNSSQNYDDEEDNGQAEVGLDESSEGNSEESSEGQDIALPDLQFRRGPTIDIESIIGRTYLSQPDEEGNRVRMRITEAIDEQDNEANNDPAMRRFRAANDDATVEDIIQYNQILEHLEPEDGQDNMWKFRAIVGHQGPLSASHSDIKDPDGT